jgi:hypothetical protein
MVQIFTSAIYSWTDEICLFVSLARGRATRILDRSQRCPSPKYRGNSVALRARSVVPE